MDDMPNFAAWDREKLEQHCVDTYLAVRRLHEEMQHLRVERADAIAAYRQLIINHERTHNDDWK